MDGGAWKDTAHGVAKSRTRLSDFTYLSYCILSFKRLSKFYISVICFSFGSVDRMKLHRTWSERSYSYPLSRPAHIQGVFALIHSVQFSSVTQSCPTLCHLMDRSTSGLPVHHQLPEFTQTHVHWVSYAKLHLWNRMFYNLINAITSPLISSNILGTTGDQWRSDYID